MAAKLVCTLETVMYRAIQEKQYSAVASNAKVLMKLVVLKAKKISTDLYLKYSAFIKAVFHIMLSC